VATDTPVPTNSPTSSQTRQHLLSVKEAESLVLDLIRTNSGCSLPCWWGVTPGKSNIEEIENLLSPFLGTVESEVRYEFSDIGGYLLMRTQPSGFNIGIQYLVENNNVSIIYVATRMVSPDGYELDFDSPIYREIMSPYSINQVLLNYGRPEQLLIRSFSELAGELNPSQILLYYPLEGVAIQYFSQNTLLIDDDIFYNKFCPVNGHINLRLFDPSSGLGLDQLLLLDDNFLEYKEISEVTNMNIETFYETYISASDCSHFIITKEEIWPHEYDNR
jgi:hypothetical protein